MLREDTPHARIAQSPVFYPSGQGKRFTAFTGGFEYTFGNVRRSGIDLGLLAEYLYDERGTGATPFEDDLFVGARVALNDIQDMQMLAGTIIDRSSQARITRLEATPRLGDTFKLDVEMLGFAGQKTMTLFILYARTIILD